MADDASRHVRTAQPSTVRAAAVVFALYGTYVLVNATVWQMIGGWAEPGQYLRGVVRFVGMALVAWGLWTGQRWAWWFAVLLGGFWILAGAGLLAVAFGFGAGELPMPLPAFIGAMAAFVLLVLGVGLLLLPSSRAALLRRAP